MLPWVRARETTFIIPRITGVASDSFYKQYTAVFDGIIDFKSQEEAGQIEQLLRVRIMRGKNYDSRWHKLRVLESGGVSLNG